MSGQNLIANEPMRRKFWTHMTNEIGVILRVRIFFFFFCEKPLLVPTFSGYFYFSP